MMPLSMFEHQKEVLLNAFVTPQDGNYATDLKHFSLISMEPPLSHPTASNFFKPQIRLFYKQSPYISPDFHIFPNSSLKHF